MNIWEHNDLSKIKVDFFGDTKVYWMDNFYKYPDLVHKEHICFFLYSEVYSVKEVLIADS